MSSEAPQHREIGQRVAYWIRRRGMTRQLFADRMGKSLSWVDKIKAGDRSLERLSVLRDIAEVLDVSLTTLIEQDEQNSAVPNVHGPDSALLEEALHSYGSGASDASPQPTDMQMLTKHVEHAWRSFQAAGITSISSALPQLLTKLHQQSHRRLGLHLLILSYQLASELAFKLGRRDLAWIAVERGIHYAELSEDPALIGGSSRRIVHAMMTTPSGRQRALALVDRTTERLAPFMAAGAGDVLSACGALYLKGSIAAAREKDASLALSLNQEAAKIASLLGTDRNIHWSAFGPTNVVIHRASAMAELGDGPGTLTAVAHIDPPSLNKVSADRRAEYFLATARGHRLCGNTTKAVSAVLQADRVGPASVRLRPNSRRLVHELIHGPGRTSSDPALRRLGQLVGIEV